MRRLSRRDFIRLGIGGVATLGLGPQIFRALDIKAMELNLAGSSHNYIKHVDRVPIAFVSTEGKIKNVCQAFVEGGDKVVQIGGHPDHIDTRGRSSPQENALHLQVYDPDRVVYPLKRTGARGSGQWKRVSWDDALRDVSERLKTAIVEGDEDRICLNIGEDTSGGAWKRFMHTIGSNSIFQQGGDVNKKVAMLHTWGEDIEVPDFSNTRYILIFGSNPFETFHPLSHRIIDGRMDMKAKIVVFDPRLSMTSGLGDEWFPLLPGTDGLVALAMANIIMGEGLADTDFINKWTNYPADKLATYLKQYTPEMAERYSGVPAKDIRRIAIEFASTRPATTFTYRGVSSHPYGVYQERACMLLPIITGNIEIKGGYCLPRRISWNEPEPIPPRPKRDNPMDRIGVFPFGKPNHLLPFLIKDGRVKIGILFNYNTNPAYSAPAASFWREVLKDEGPVPYIVEIGPFMSETASLADLILPDAVTLERNEPVSSPSLWPWLGIRQSTQRPLGESKEVRMILRDIIHAIDPDGGKGLKRYWGFEGPEDWLKGNVDGVPGFKGKADYAFLKENGVWPIYGILDPQTKRVLDDKGKPVEAEYGIHKKKGFKTPSGRIELFVKGFEKDSLPVWKEEWGYKDLKEGEFILITFKDRYHSGSRTANNKFLSEASHSNPVWINQETAKRIGIEDGALIKVASPAGYIVGKAMVTNAIHQKVIGISASCGHWAYGRVSQARPKEDPQMEFQGTDPDIHHNLWWDDNGISPNDIIYPSADPIGGGQSWGIVVRITPAGKGDRYKDVKVDNSIHYGFYKKAIEGIK